MAGGVLKGSGIGLTVLGIVLMLGGLAAAAYGYNDQQENHDRLLPSGERDDNDQAVMVGGGIGFAAGLVVLIVGVILNAAGNGRRHREILQAAVGRMPATPAAAGAAAAPAPATAAAASTVGPASAPKPATPASPSSQKGLAIALTCLGVVALVFLTLIATGKGGSAVGFGGDGPAFAAQDYDGTVRQAFSLPVAGSATTDTAASQQDFNAPAGARSLHLEVTWDRADAGADSLEVIVEKASPAWTEAGRSTGGSPVVLDLPLDSSSLHLRYRVLPGGEGAVYEQPFHVHVTFA